MIRNVLRVKEKSIRNDGNKVAPRNDFVLYRATFFYCIEEKRKKNFKKKEGNQYDNQTKRMS